MSLTRAYLKSLGLEEEKISSIIEAHSETVSALNQRYSELEARYNDAKQSADQLPELQKELETMKKEDLGVILGAAVTYSHYYFGANYERSLKSLSKTDDKSYNSSIVISLGYNF